jgi:hypothetical protein
MSTRPDDARHDEYDEWTVRHVQPYEAVKAYRCPGCDHEIPPGLGHEVVVPTLEPSLRRHWHSGCWFKEQQRRARARR